MADEEQAVPADGPAGRRRRPSIGALALMVGALATLVGTRLAASDGGAPPPAEADRAARRVLDGLRFVDVTRAAGLAGAHTDRALEGVGNMSSGVVVDDLVGSPLDDVFAPRLGRANGLFRNEGGGRFVDVAAAAGVARVDGMEGVTVARAFDADGDGCRDLFLLGEGPRASALLRNRCDGTFGDETAERGFVLEPEVSAFARRLGMTVWDVDRDGDLDVLVLQWDAGFLEYAQPLEEGADVQDACDRARRRATTPRDPGRPANGSRLLLNDGSGRFRDATSAWNLDLGAVAAFTGQFHDVDGDGWDDLVIAGDFCTSRLLRNVGGERFEDVTERLGPLTDENGMGSVLRDLDGDGRAEWFVSSIGLDRDSCLITGDYGGCSGNRVYAFGPDGRVTDETDVYGVRFGGWAWGIAVEDLRDDGRPMAVQVGGYRHPELDSPDPGTARFFEDFLVDGAHLWDLEGTGSVAGSDLARTAGFVTEDISHGLVPFDHDGDGALDLLVGSTPGGLRLFRNERPAGRSWLTVRLDDASHPGNRAGLGARVRITGPDGRAVWGWIDPNGSFQSQKPAELHVGFGDVDGPVRRVEVWWPGSEEPQRVEDVATDQVLVVRRAG